jgi:uncharacterized membrane protein YedE/YeeE
MSLIFSLLAGVIFGAGLTLSGMVNPARVLNFLDFAGSGDKFNLPTQRQIDLSLVGGRRAVWRGVGPCWHLPRPGLRKFCGS